MTVDAGPVTHAAIEHRLLTMRRSIRQLESLGPIDGKRLSDDPTTGLVLERILALLFDLAEAVNVDAGPATGRRRVIGSFAGSSGQSFADAARAGVISSDLAADLALADGPVHVQLQLSLDSDPVEAAAVVTRALRDYRNYVQRVEAWLEFETRRPSCGR